MTAHYPTSAELAAFRRQLADKPYPFMFPVDGGGALPHEREQGIGFRDFIDYDAEGRMVGSVGGATYAEARREASRLRLPDYAANEQYAALISDSAEAADWHAAIQTFTPEPDPDAACPSCHQAYRLYGHHSDCWLHP